MTYHYVFFALIVAVNLGVAVGVAFQDPPPVEPGEVAPGVGLVEEVRIYPPVPASHLRNGPPPEVAVVQVPHPLRTSRLLRIRFSTKGRDGDPTRGAWIVLSPELQTPPINIGTEAEPVLQMVKADHPNAVALPFPAGQAREWLGMFTRDMDSGVIWLQGELELNAPIFFQLAVEAPEENATGLVTSYAHGLIPGEPR